MLGFGRVRLLLSIVCVCLALGAPLALEIAETGGTGEAPSMTAADGSDEPAQPTDTEDSPSSADAVLTAPHSAPPRHAITGDGPSLAPMPDSVDRPVPVPPPVG